jgi:hypothetical protein
MDEKLQILLNSKKNIASVDQDNYQKLELENKVGQIIEYDIRNALSATEIFDAEREANPIYRIYGRIEYLSLLNGLSNNYNNVGNFFISTGGTNVKTIFNSFKFYLLKAASSGYTHITGGSSTINYVRYFEVIAGPSDFELYNAGYSNNVYGEQTYAFNFNKDFDITPYTDAFGFPATELYLYPQYQVGKNGNSPQIPETMSGTSWGTNGIQHKVLFTSPLPTLNIGDRVYGDLIEYAKSEFFQNQLTPQTYYISTAYKDGSTQKYLQWKYNPFIPFILRYFNDALNNVNTGTTSYGQQISIPYYATLLTGGTVGNGNYVWKDILPQGFIDPVTNQGVDYPFVNMRRYLFSPIILDISPNLQDSNTLQVFTQIQFGPPTIMNTAPQADNLGNIGKPCQ